MVGYKIARQARDKNAEQRQSRPDKAKPGRGNLDDAIILTGQNHKLAGHAVEVVDVSSGSVAERSGIATGDLIVAINDRVVAAGSSPATVSLHDLQESATLLSVTLTDDTRHEIRSIAVWPF